MRLYEYEAKEIFQKHGLAIPKGQVIESAEEARRFASQIGGPVVIKPQVLTKKRGKAGAIRFGSDPDEAFRESQLLLGMTLKEEKVSKLLVEETSPTYWLLFKPELLILSPRSAVSEDNRPILWMVAQSPRPEDITMLPPTSSV